MMLKLALKYCALMRSSVPSACMAWMAWLTGPTRSLPLGKMKPSSSDAIAGPISSSASLFSP